MGSSKTAFRTLYDLPGPSYAAFSNCEPQRHLARGRGGPRFNEFSYPKVPFWARIRGRLARGRGGPRKNELSYPKVPFRAHIRVFSADFRRFVHLKF